MSARTPKYSWAPPAARRKPTNTSSKISTMPRSVQTSRSCFSHSRIGRAVEIAAARAVDQRGIAGRTGVRMQRLQRIDQHAGDVAPRAQHVQRPLRHVGQRVGLVRRHRIADAGLHVAPPAVIGAGKAHQMRAARCDSAPAAPPASRLRCRTCGTRLRRARRSRTAARRCRRSRDDRDRAPGRARARASRRSAMHSL